MHSLYWRIFLSFWLALALILVGTVTVAVNVAIQKRSERPWIQREQLYTQAEQAFRTGGPGALRDWLTGMRGQEPFARTFIVDPSGRELLHRPLPGFIRSPHDSPSEPDRTTAPIAPIGGALVLAGPTGPYHVIVGPLALKQRLFGDLEQPGVPTATLAIALIVSGVICFLLARYLVAPVDRLRLVTRQLAAGDLNVSVSGSLKGRQDDLGLLAADLDSMAGRLRSLLESKEQLLRDVSHELRSPLARMQLALSLARRTESGVERHLDRIACEADRLEQLIARTLKLARLERAGEAFERVPIDVSELLTNIVADVAIEAEAQGCTVALNADPVLQVCGDMELIRSTFENVIRNAIRYSPSGSEVSIDAHLAPRSAHAEIVVRDRGPGVPEKDLSLIFEPFYRVGSARDRAGGGEGLGLAIAARAVAAHGGAIEASNVARGGLAVCIELPALAQGTSPGSAEPPRAIPKTGSPEPVDTHAAAV
ncbi:MAG TPA: ATP-binding protein [Steroidobacteraceae bacterium]|nr:ATP-binding protein [Steroidobacteraceae bacterium]